MTCCSDRKDDSPCYECLLESIERVRELHKEVEVFYRGEIILGCEYCFKASKYFREIFEYPCETIKALDGDK